jgi:hypothetical protein
MAMLGLSEVFEQAWGWALPPRPRPQDELWGHLIRRVRAAHPNVIFIAEAYWGLETRLLELGFDYAYDKRLYDLVRDGSAVGIRHHLSTAGPLLQRSVRFIENHDELRAPVAFGRERSQAAAIVMMTLPGLRLVNDGQVDGRRIRLPLQLVREPLEPVDQRMADFYDRLLTLTNARAFHHGTWTLLDVGPAVLWDESYRHLVAWIWTHGSRHSLVALNQSGTPAHGRVCQPPEGAWPTATWTDLLEPLRPARVDRCDAGVNIHLSAWSVQLLGAEGEQEVES